jgi:hypothetical protein
MFDAEWEEQYTSIGVGFIPLAVMLFPYSRASKINATLFQNTKVIIRSYPYAGRIKSKEIVFHC